MRHAECACGQLKADCEGEPGRISVCHCLNCQRRSGSAFAVQARFPADQVTITGQWKTFTLRGDEGGIGTFRFCPECGVTVAYAIDAMPGLLAIPVGTFADPQFPPPAYSVYEERMHAWTGVLGPDVEHMD